MNTDQQRELFKKISKNQFSTMKQSKSGRSRLEALARENGVPVNRRRDRSSSSSGTLRSEFDPAKPHDEMESPPPFPTTCLCFGSSANNCLGPVTRRDNLKRSIYPTPIVAPPPPPFRQRRGTGEGRGKTITPGSVVPSSNCPYK